MNTTMSTTIETIAAEFANAFEAVKRDDGSTCVRLRKDAPEWVNSDLMHDLHRAVDGRLPDDWIFDRAHAIAENLAEYTDPDGDSLSEVCEACLDTSSYDLGRWYADHGGNRALCQEAQDDGLLAADAGIDDRISAGQYLGLHRIGAKLLEIFQARAETLNA